jgi:diguanylate cyclase (GGDEF)-like protein
MFVGGAMGAVFLAGGFSFLFRLDIDRAERDLTRSNNELARLSALDPLTGLANRRTLDAYLTREWARLCREDRHLGVLLCDVDYFKEFNDHYGHLAGDTCLQRVATALSGAAQRSGDLVARYGGEEFILVLGMTDPAHASDVAEKARAIVMDLGLPHGRSAVAPVVTISVGVVVAAANDLVEPQDLLQRADQALYAAKHQGRNRVVHAGPPAVLEAGAPLSSTQA